MVTSCVLVAVATMNDIFVEFVFNIATVVLPGCVLVAVAFAGVCAAASNGPLSGTREPTAIAIGFFRGSVFAGDGVVDAVGVAAVFADVVIGVFRGIV